MVSSCDYSHGRQVPHLRGEDDHTGGQLFHKVVHLSFAIAKLLPSCPTLCDPIDGSPPGFPVTGILQARTLEWVAISFSNAWKWKVKVRSLSHVRLSVTPWTADFQAPPSMRFSRQKYWSGVPLPSPWSPFNKHTATFTLPKVTDFSKLWPPCDGIPSQH